MDKLALITTPCQHVLLQPGVRHCGKELVFDVVRLAVAKAFADLNYKKITAEERDYLLNELTKAILDRYPHIRLTEIPDAIALGIRGHYGEYFGLSVITFEKFIAAHLATEQRLQAVQSLPPPPASALTLCCKIPCWPGSAKPPVKITRAWPPWCMIF